MVVRVMRHTSQYGTNTIKDSGKTDNSWYAGYAMGWVSYPPSPMNGVKGISLRQHPVNGRIIAGFRMPTKWSMCVLRNSGSSYDYYLLKGTKSAYWYKGEGVWTSHVVGIQPYANFNTGVVTISSNLSNRTNVEALNKLKDESINVAVALAESKKTIAWLAMRVSALLRAYRFARQGRWASAADAAITGSPNAKIKVSRKKGLIGPTQRGKETRPDSSLKDRASSNWLEYQYAFLPLMSDIFGLQEQIKKGFADHDQIFSVARQLSQKLPKADFVPSSIYAHVDGIGGTAVELSKTVYYGKISNANLLAISQLGVANPLVVAWELVPFSFVLDWLLPIGAFLESLTATLGVTFVAGFEDRIVSTDLTYQTYATVGGGYTFSHGKKCVATTRSFCFERRLKLGWDLSIPYIKSPFSTSHVASAIALLHATSRGR